MPTAEIITIGTEILLGEITDTNSRYIAHKLREAGIDIYRTTSIGDNPQRIAAAIRDSLGRADIIITTGGLGPTVDDPTREAVADAFGVSLEFHEELWQQVIRRFAGFGKVPSDNNRKQAFIPAGANALPNPVGTAPAFRVETGQQVVVSLPGVPGEMKHLMEHSVLPYLVERYQPDSVLKVRVLHTVGVGESQIDERIGDLEALLNPTVGLAAHAGRVDVRITAKAGSSEEADRAIADVEHQVRERLGSWIFGADEETLEEAAMRNLASRDWSLVLLEAGLSGRLISSFRDGPANLLFSAAHPRPPESPGHLSSMVAELRRAWQADVGLGVGLHAQDGQSFLNLALITPEGEKNRQIPYGGPPVLAPARATNYGLDWLRKIK